MIHIFKQDCQEYLVEVPTLLFSLVIGTGYYC